MPVLVHDCMVTFYVHTVAKIFNIDRIYSDSLCLFCYNVWVNELMVPNVSSGKGRESLHATRHTAPSDLGLKHSCH